MHNLLSNGESTNESATAESVTAHQSDTCGTVTLVEPSPNIQVSCTNPSPSQLDPGETLEVTGSLENTGNADANVTYEWTVNGSRLGTSATATVQAGRSVNVSTSAPYDRIADLVTPGTTFSVELNVFDVRNA